VTDGLRWQEVFRGAETALVSTKLGGVEDEPATKKAFWRETAAAKREALLPFFWTVIAKEGQLYGNRDAGSSAQVTNGYKFSYPGYNEIVTGAPDPRIDKNEFGKNPNVSVFEWLNGLPELRSKVGVVGGWEVFNDIFNRDRAGIGFAVGDAGHRIAHRGSAALRGDDPRDVGALLLEVAFLESDRERHAVGRAAVISDGDVLGHCRGGKQHPEHGHDR